MIIKWKLIILSVALPLLIFSPLLFALHEEKIILQEDFETKIIDTDKWHLQLGEKNSFIRLEADKRGGECLHLFGKDSASALTTTAKFANAPYRLQFDFLQPKNEDAGYQSVIHQPRPEGHSYWWLEYGFGRFFLYTVAGTWVNRWQAYGYQSDTWYHITVENSTDRVKISISDSQGKLLAESGFIPHDSGSPSPIVFAAIGTKEKGDRGFMIDNVKVTKPPIAERADFSVRKQRLERALQATSEPVYQAIDAQGTAPLLEAIRSALQKTEATDPADDEAYLKNIQQLDSLFDQAEARYRDKEEAISERLLAEKPRPGYRFIDLKPYFSHRGDEVGLVLETTSPIYEKEGIPFRVMPFGKNAAYLTDASTESLTIPINQKVGQFHLLLGSKFNTGRFSSGLESYADAFLLDIRYENGKSERVFPEIKPTGENKMKEGAIAAYSAVPALDEKIAALRLLDRTAHAGFALFGLTLGDQKPGMPPLPPPIIYQHFLKPPKPVKITLKKSTVTIENAYFLTRFSIAQGLMLTGLKNQFTSQDYLKGAASPIFLIQVSEPSQAPKKLSSKDFVVSGIRKKKGKELQVIFSLASKPNLPRLSGELVITAGTSSRMLWSLNLRNQGKSIISLAACFPLLEGLNLGEDCGYFYPQRGGLVSDLPIDISGAYGGPCWMQVVDAFEGTKQGGIYLRADDTKGIEKFFALRKLSPGKEPAKSQEMSEPALRLYFDPFQFKAGLGMAIEYLGEQVNPNQEIKLPSAAVGLHIGDWHKALWEYQAWSKTWWKNRRTPEFFRKAMYAVVGGPPQDEGKEFGGFDFWHLSPFWSLDYVSELGKEIAWLKEQKEKAKKWNQDIGIYIEGMVMEKKRRIAKEKGEEFAMVDDQGKFYDYYSSPDNPCLAMCPASKGWQKFAAENYAALAKEVGFVAMYVDSTGSRRSEFCWNPKHNHKTPGIWVQGCGALYKAIRDAVMKVDPNCAIHSEEPGSDYAAMFEDGAWSHSLWVGLSGDERYNPMGLNFFRFVYPQFKMFEIPSYDITITKIKLAFFNGEGLWAPPPAEEKIKNLYVKVFPILRQFSDVFTSSDCQPDIGTSHPNIFANRFAKGDKVIYTLYNNGYRTAEAEIIVPHRPTCQHIDLMENHPIKAEAKGKGDILKISLDPKEIAFIGQMPVKKR